MREKTIWLRIISALPAHFTDGTKKHIAQSLIALEDGTERGVQLLEKGMPHENVFAALKLNIPKRVFAAIMQLPHKLKEISHDAANDLYLAHTDFGKFRFKYLKKNKKAEQQPLQDSHYMFAQHNGHIYLVLREGPATGYKKVDNSFVWPPRNRRYTQHEINLINNGLWWPTSEVINSFKPTAPHFIDGLPLGARNIFNSLFPHRSPIISWSEYMRCVKEDLGYEDAFASLVFDRNIFGNKIKNNMNQNTTPNAPLSKDAKLAKINQLQKEIEQLQVHQVAVIGIMSAGNNNVRPALALSMTSAEKAKGYPSKERATFDAVELVPCFQVVTTGKFVDCYIKFVADHLQGLRDQLDELL